MGNGLLGMLTTPPRSFAFRSTRIRSLQIGPKQGQRYCRQFSVDKCFTFGGQLCLLQFGTTLRGSYGPYGAGVRHVEIPKVESPRHVYPLNFSYSTASGLSNKGWGGSRVTMVGEELNICCLRGTTLTILAELHEAERESRSRHREHFGFHGWGKNSGLGLGIMSSGGGCGLRC